MEADKEIVVLALDAKNIAKDLEEGFSYPLLNALRSRRASLILPEGRM